MQNIGRKNGKKWVAARLTPSANMPRISSIWFKRAQRHDAQSPFLLELQNVHDMQQLLDSLDSLENEYKKNVQAFTYDRVMASLEEHGMCAESESVLDDESILLTLSL